MTARVDYQPKASGATYASKSNTLDEDGWVWVPVTAGFIPAVAQAQYQTGDEEDEHIAVPLWVLAMLVDGATSRQDSGFPHPTAWSTLM